jgi:hypothetical protein
MLTKKPVFLRVLDYYDGVLFLTTNRAGVLDEAFISRIHSKILYQDLTLAQTLDIWKLNIQRLRNIDAELAKIEKRDELQINQQELLDFAAYLFDEGTNRARTPGRWNGRQIRNAFQVARSLSYYEYHRNPTSGPPILSVRHFKTMHDITASFDHYRTTIRGGTDAELALESEYRNDRFHDHVTRGWQSGYQEEHHKKAATEIGEDGGAFHNPNVAVTTTVAVSDRAPPPPQQRPRIQQHPTDGDETPASPGDSLSMSHNHHQHHHRESVDSASSFARHRSNSHLSAHGAYSSSPPAREMSFDGAATALRRFPAAGHSPRHGPVQMRDQDVLGNYIPVSSSRPGLPTSSSSSNNYAYGNQAYQYGSSPRDGGGFLPGPRGAPQNMPMADNVTPVVTGNWDRGGRGYTEQEFAGHGGGVVPGTGTGGMGRRYGSGSGWNPGVGGSQGYAGGYGGQGRGRDTETDLSLDD